MKVSDVMSRQIDFVRPDDRVQRVAVLIFGRGVNGVPVCEGKKLVGFVSENDILQKFFPSLRELDEDRVKESNFELMEEKASTILSLPVSKIMSSVPLTVKADTPLLRAQSMMKINEVGRLPVVDSEKNLIGIISKGDVFKALIGQQISFTENEDYNDFLSKTYYSTVDWDDRIKKEIPDLVKLLEKHKAKTILDVGTGTGDYAIELASRGYTVVGTDRSKAMIDEANRRKISLSSKNYGNIHFWNKDTEDFLYEMDIKFDAILIMGNSLSHNPENYRRLIKKCADSLSENGIMIFQTTNFEKILKVKKRMWSVNFVPVENEPVKEYSFIQFYDKPIKEKTILKTFAILSFDGKRWSWSGIRNSIMAYTNEARIKSILKNEGFSKIETYGGSFDGRSWDHLFRKQFKPMESDWLNVVATNKK